MNQALAIQAPHLPSVADWGTLREMANVFLKSGLLPQTIKTAEAALTVMIKARELSIPPLYGLSNIVVVQGKPACSSELMLALVYRDHGDNALIIEESSSLLARASYRRAGWDKPREYTFTIEDARTANLTKNPTWGAYPAAMLRARVISAVARMAFPDSIAGMYLPEELGARVTVRDDGEIEIDHEPERPALAPPPPTPIRPTPPVPAYDVPPPDPDRYTSWEGLVNDPDRAPDLMAGAVTGALPLGTDVHPDPEPDEASPEMRDLIEKAGHLSFRAEAVQLRGPVKWPPTEDGMRRAIDTFRAQVAREEARLANPEGRRR